MVSGHYCSNGARVHAATHLWNYTGGREMNTLENLERGQLSVLSRVPLVPEATPAPVNYWL